MTAATITAIISALLSIIRFCVEYAQKRSMIDDITAQILLQANKDSDDAIAKAGAARKAVRDRNTLDPDSVLRDDDGFKRPD